MIIFYGLIAFSVAMMIVGHVLMHRKKAVNTAKALAFSGDAVLVLLGTLLFLFGVSFGGAYPLFWSVIIIATAVLTLAVIAGRLWGFLKKRGAYIPICICAALTVLSAMSFWGYKFYINNMPTISESNEILEVYAPYTEDTKVATLDEESTLKLSSDIPKMDGATALYPVYSAFAKAVYPRETIEGTDFKTSYSDDKYLFCNTTKSAYRNIVNGDADIIFVASPSEEQEQYADEMGVELVYTPIGREAFVFFVNSKNPIHNLSYEDIKGIYSGEIRDWNHFGISGLGKIKAFQREEGSGSQSTLIKMMGDTPLMTPPKQNVAGGMGMIIEKASDYRNHRNAIGYSFRFYSTEMVENNQIKLLSVDGVYPSLENIENGTYPIASEFYAVTRSDADENTQKLLNWILSDQGQELIEKTGYTKLNK